MGSLIVLEGESTPNRQNFSSPFTNSDDYNDVLTPERCA